jgi:hypothetical protein
MRSFRNAPSDSLQPPVMRPVMRPVMGHIRRHPIASILSLWVILVGLGMLSTHALVTLDVADGPANVPANGSDNMPADVPANGPVPAAATPKLASDIPDPASDRLPDLRVVQPQQESSSLLSTGVIAVSCALGCLVLSQLTRPYPQRTTPERSRSRSAALSLERHAAELQSGSESSDSNERYEAESHQEAVDVKATLVPHDQQNPLDWDEPSLADSLDLRQRRPLSHWL